eukprot:UN25173
MIIGYEDGQLQYQFHQMQVFQEALEYERNRLGAAAPTPGELPECFIFTLKKNSRNHRCLPRNRSSSTVLQTRAVLKCISHMCYFNF